MKILYDHQIFSIQRYGGISKYFCEMTKRFPMEHKFIFSVLFSDNQHLRDNFPYFKKPFLPVNRGTTSIGGFLRAQAYKINNYYSRHKISENNFDIFHPTYFDPYFLNHLRKPFVLTVHDLIPFKYRGLYNNDAQMMQFRECVNKAQHIIAVSENTKNDLIEILKTKPEKIDVIYHGFNRIVSKHTPNQLGRYILYVGTRWGYKNFFNLAKAFSRVKKKDKDLKLVCVGAQFNKEELIKIKHLQIEDNIMALTVNEDKLNQIYSNALALIYPSEYEGFGMPILEAFANNCPVCLSNKSCFPEIAGDAGIYFDPTEIESISNAIKTLIYNREISYDLVKKGELRLNKFSWEKCSEQTINVYKKVV